MIRWFVLIGLCLCVCVHKSDISVYVECRNASFTLSEDAACSVSPPPPWNTAPPATAYKYFAQVLASQLTATTWFYVRRVFKYFTHHITRCLFNPVYTNTENNEFFVVSLCSFHFIQITSPQLRQDDNH